MMKPGAGRRLATLALVLGVAISLTGCALIEFVTGPLPVTLWKHARRTAELLADHMAGDDGYYAKDASMAADERKKRADDLRDILATLKGPPQKSAKRRALEARLAVHAEKFLTYVDGDDAWKPKEKKKLKDPIEAWLKRVGKGH